MPSKSFDHRSQNLPTLAPPVDYAIGPVPNFAPQNSPIGPPTRLSLLAGALEELRAEAREAARHAPALPAGRFRIALANTLIAEIAGLVEAQGFGTRLRPPTPLPETTLLALSDLLPVLGQAGDVLAKLQSHDRVGQVVAVMETR